MEKLEYQIRVLRLDNLRIRPLFWHIHVVILKTHILESSLYGMEISFRSRLLTTRLMVSLRNTMPNIKKFLFSYCKADAKGQVTRLLTLVLIERISLVEFMREKGRDVTQSYDKNPTPTKKSKKQRDNINATKNLDYTTTADRLKTVSWSNNSQPTGVVKPVYERSTSRLTATAV